MKGLKENVQCQGLVKFMENLGYIDQVGRGLPMVYQEAVSNGKKVVFEEIGEQFKVMLEV